MTIGIAADHGGFLLKEVIKKFLITQNYEVTDYGAYELNKEDDYPDFVTPLAKAISLKQVARGIAICGSGVGASIAANKIVGVRAALIHDGFSSHQGVEDDDMNLLCLGGRVVGDEMAKELIVSFLKAKYIGAERHQRRLNKVLELEKNK